MTTIPLNLISLPFVLVIWFLDSLLFLVIARLVAGKFTSVRPTKAYQAILQLTDPLVTHVDQWLDRCIERSMPPWTPWLTTILGLVIGRYLLVWTLIALSVFHA